MTPPSSPPSVRLPGRGRRRRRGTRALAVVTAVVCGSALAACSTSTAGPAETGTVRTVLNSDPSSFDPAQAQGQQTFQVASLLYDTLLRRDSDARLVGGLATDWATESASEFTFTIRDDATCSDGTPITASVVADSLRRLADPATESTWKSLVFGLGDVDVAADDRASTVRISLSEPFTTLPQGLAIPQSGIVCPAGIADAEALEAGSVAGAFSGPYTVQEAQQGLNYTFALREDYAAWPEFSTPLTGEPPRRLEIGVSTDQSTVANQILAGDLDLGQFADPDAVKRFTAQPDLHQYQVISATAYVVFNQREGRPFAGRPDLRRAVAQAINQEAFNAIFTKRTADVLTSVTPASFRCTNTDRSLLPEHDPDAASELLSDVSGVQLIGNTANRQFSGGADYLFAALTEAGAEVNMSKVDNATFWSTIAEGGSDWDIVFLGDLNSVGAISASLDRVIGPSVEDGGRNYSASDNPEGEAALAEGLASTDPEAQCDAFDRAQRTLFERSDIVPLAGSPLTYVTGPDLTVSVFDDYVDLATMRVGAE
ncbi:ABC transporter substrate-binding protein [Prauserella cavernicola]|uniref:ABC transporter substrate-binding protein n=1 Tax=Prauserella cavernicola TaxID=2800127 RepID=A0A934V1M8_9PSEU|nr:ABC transporter substrate-binding protein [Prauserella cavernicola]MBK1783536.1 ABC transporter substrate-binding protein [Prauserella cavernicola]